MTSARKVLGSGSFYTLATVAPILTLLAVTPVVTQVLGAHEYGQVAVAISVYQVGSVLLGFGLPMMVTRDALLTAAGFRAATAHVCTGAVLALAGAGIAIGVSPIWVPMVFPGVDVAVVALSIVAGAGLAAVTLAQGVMRAAERVGTFVVMASFAAFVPPLCGLALITLVSADAFNYSAGLAVGYLVSGIGALTLAMKHTRPMFVVADELRALRVALPTVPHGLAVPALLSVVMAIVIHTDGVSTAGPLQIAVMLGSAVVTILNAVNNAWAPLVMKASDRDRRVELRESSVAVGGLTLLLVCGFTVLAPVVVPLIGGPVVAGSDVVRAACVVAFAGVFHVMYLANINLIFISQRTWPLAITTPLSAVAAIVTSLVLAQSFPPRWLLLAYSATWPIFYAFQAIASFLLARVSPYRPADLRPTMPLLAASLIAASQAIVASPQPFWSGITAALSLVVGVIVVLRVKSGPRGSGRRSSEP